MALSAGNRLGPYEIVAPIGAGGMGAVYKARDTRLDRIVAVKVLTGAAASLPEGRQRLDREARAVSSLNHPHICSLFDIGNGSTPQFIQQSPKGAKLCGIVAKACHPRKRTD